MEEEFIHNLDIATNAKEVVSNKNLKNWNTSQE